MFRFLAAAAFTLTFGEAAAQTPPEPATQTPPVQAESSVFFEARPVPNDFARVYPRRALRNGVGGVVVLDCLVLEGGALQCTVFSEEPPGYGFGRASLSLVPQFRAALQTRDGRSTIGGRARFPLTFHAD